MADTAVLDAQTPTVEGRARPGDAALAARLDALDPVSYTHLTLPTSELV